MTESWLEEDCGSKKKVHLGVIFNIHSHFYFAPSLILLAKIDETVVYPVSPFHLIFYWKKILNHPERIKILAVGASLREHFEQHNEATGMSRHRFFRHNLNPATNERFACGGEENAGKCDSSIPKAIHPPSLQRKIDNIRRLVLVAESSLYKTDYLVEFLSTLV